MNEISFCPYCGSKTKKISIKRKPAKWANKPSSIPAYKCENCKVKFRVQVFKK